MIICKVYMQGELWVPFYLARFFLLDDTTCRYGYHEVRTEGCVNASASYSYRL